MINSLYGMLGMSKITTETLLISRHEYNWYNKNFEIKSFKEMNDLMIIEVKISEKLKNIFKNISKNNVKTNIAVASAITAKARVKLYKAQSDIIEAGGRLLYSDTDSIIAAFPKEMNVLDV
jgi:DNA polymerase elongation subunit (family B)